MKKTIIIAIAVLAIVVGVSVASALTVPQFQYGYIYQWTSNNPSKVSVDPNTGYIWPINKGVAEICAQLKSDLSVKFCNTVTVQ